MYKNALLYRYRQPAHVWSTLMIMQQIVLIPRLLARHQAAQCDCLGALRYRCKHWMHAVRLCCMTENSLHVYWTAGCQDAPQMPCTPRPRPQMLTLKLLTPHCAAWLVASSGVNFGANSRSGFRNDQNQRTRSCDACSYCWWRRLCTWRRCQGACSLRACKQP